MILLTFTQIKSCFSVVVRFFFSFLFFSGKKKVSQNLHLQFVGLGFYFVDIVNVRQSLFNPECG